MQTTEIITKLREDADGWEGCGKALGFLDADDEKRNAERCVYLRAAADQLEARLITGAKEAKSIPLSVTALMFAFVDECRTMSHSDRASTALTLIRELKTLADEEAAASAAQN